MPEKDPLTQVYEALWEILEANEGFCNLVLKQNRIRYTDNDLLPAFRHPERVSRQPTEYPQVVITAGGAPSHLYNSSDGTEIFERFQIWVLTGDRRLCYEQDDVYQGLFPVTWAILRALMDWETHMGILSWNGRQGFVTHCSITDRQLKMGTPRIEEQVAPVKTTGWSMAWQGDVYMVFPSEGTSGLKE